MRTPGQRSVLGERQRGDIGDRLHEHDRAFGQLAHRADDFRMAAMADQHDGAATLVVQFGFAMHFRD